MSEDSDDVPEVVNFFSKRAKFVPKVSPEEFEATSKFLEEIRAGKSKCPLTEDIEYPPPKKRGKRKALAKDKSDVPVEITLEEDEQNVPSSFESPLPAAAKRRLRKLQRDRERELKSIEEANQEVLSSLTTPGTDDIEDVDVDSFEKIIVLTISYLSEISRLKCNEHEKFSTIFPKVADLFKLKVSEFLLCHRDKNIKTDDTPKSLNIADTDILECIPYKDDRETEIKYDEDKLQVFFQASDSKKKTEMFVHKLEKMHDIMEKYSNCRNIPLKQLVFEFDGEQISGTETPEDLDMESGSCIDVRVLAAEDKQSRKASNKRSKTVIVTVDIDSDDSDVILCD